MCVKGFVNAPIVRRPFTKSWFKVCFSFGAHRIMVDNVSLNFKKSKFRLLCCVSKRSIFYTYKVNHIDSSNSG